MKTISNREFIANPDMYMGMAKEQDVRIRRGRTIYRLVCEPPATAQPVHQPDDDFRRALSAEEFREKLAERMKRLDEKYARPCHANPPLAASTSSFRACQRQA